jgi:hypothetical protein
MSECSAQSGMKVRQQLGQVRLFCGLASNLFLRKPYIGTRQAPAGKIDLLAFCLLSNAAPRSGPIDSQSS